MLKWRECKKWPKCKKYFVGYSTEFHINHRFKKFLCLLHVNVYTLYRSISHYENCLLSHMSVLTQAPSHFHGLAVCGNLYCLTELSLMMIMVRYSFATKSYLKQPLIELRWKLRCLHSWALQWCHNEHGGVSEYQRLHCLLNCWFSADQRKHQSSTSLAFVRGIHR